MIDEVAIGAFRILRVGSQLPGRPGGVGRVALSLVVGPAWGVISPMRTVYLLLRRVAPERVGWTRRSYPEGWGCRPAAVGLFAFVWMELAGPNSASLPGVRAWLLVYAVLMLGGAWVCGCL